MANLPHLSIPFQLPELGYDPAALEPHIDARTMEIHHGKHHATYVANLNAALAKHPEYQETSLERMLAALAAVPDPIRMAVRNNGGGHLNHTLFWRMIAPGGAKLEDSRLAPVLAERFGSVAQFQAQFEAAALARFGSGWAWLSMAPDGGLDISSTPNQDSPVMEGRIPMLGLDVWEHAYYLKYQNRRAEYAKAFWNVVNWTVVEEIYRQRG